MADGALDVRRTPVAVPGAAVRPRHSPDASALRLPANRAARSKVGAFRRGCRKFSRDAQVSGIKPHLGHNHQCYAPIMRKLAVFSLLFLSAGPGQTQKMPRKVPGMAKPECASGAICFSGQVREGEEFRKALNADLEFVLRLPGGFDVISRRTESSCNLSLWAANPPLMAHHDTEIDAGYDWTAEQEVETSPREFRFVENCREYQNLYDLLYDPSKADARKYLNELKALKGRGRLWITDSKVSHSHGSVSVGNGAIEWVRFSAEITLPNAN